MLWQSFSCCSDCFPACDNCDTESASPGVRSDWPSPGKSCGHLNLGSNPPVSVYQELTSPLASFSAVVSKSISWGKEAAEECLAHRRPC